MLIGLVMFAFSLAYPLIAPSLYQLIDNTKPTLVSTDPANYTTYTTSINILTARVTDDGGVSSVEANVWPASGFGGWLTGPKIEWEPLFLTEGTKYDGVWTTWSQFQLASPGYYLIEWHLEDEAGNLKLELTWFQIYAPSPPPPPPTVFSGKCFINNVEISPNHFFLTFETTFNFRFTKTEGLDDTRINCILWCFNDTARVQLLELSHTEPSTWEADYTFAPGIYDLELVANDGTNQLAFAITLEIIGEEPQIKSDSALRTILVIGGLSFFCIGYIIRLKKPS